ncbi:MAG: DUF3021 domain-containing protein [Clostridia bacterium]|nr:DUF3021 domain-containing protein [Clostridia bacterium]
MNKYVKEFLHRGLIFGGFGPIILGIVYWIISTSGASFGLSGFETFLGIISTYLLAFLQAGASVFNQIEHWSLPKSLLCHFSTLFVAYSLCYLGNTWIPFEPAVIAIFFAIFTAIYFVVWITVYLSVRAASKKFNNKLK